MKKLILISALLFSMNGWADGLTLLCKGEGGNYLSTDYGDVGFIVEGQKSSNAEIIIKFDSTFETGSIKIPKLMNDKSMGTKKTTFDLKEINVSENEISSKFKLKFFDSPSFTINRVTGYMEYNGGTNSMVKFSGYCEQTKLDEKKF
tara:strand:- start:527 stop:967 length:441 start_codon:yes stop_codon:yes gene_type:complete